MLKRLAITLLLFSWAAPAIADDTGKANEPLVEAVQLIQSADKAASWEKRLRLSEEALSNLNKIVERYPSTDLAVKLVSGQTIGRISLESAAEAVEEAHWRLGREAREAEERRRRDRQREAAAREAEEERQREARKAEERQKCLASPTYRCVITRALATAATDFYEDCGICALGFGVIAKAQAEVGDIQGAKGNIMHALAAVTT